MQFAAIQRRERIKTSSHTHTHTHTDTHTHTHTHGSSPSSVNSLELEVTLMKGTKLNSNSPQWLRTGEYVKHWSIFEQKTRWKPFTRTNTTSWGKVLEPTTLSSEHRSHRVFANTFIALISQCYNCIIWWCHSALNLWPFQIWHVTTSSFHPLRHLIKSYRNYHMNS